MSKAFTKDDSESPLVVPPRPPLPKGVTNYVTTRGLARLRVELRALEVERARLESRFDEQNRPDALSARIVELEERLASAVWVDPSAQPHDEIRFGASVTVRADGAAPKRYQIVGVDEVDIPSGRVAFVAPLARALLGKRVGDIATVQTPHGEGELEVLAIAYEEDGESTASRARA